MSRVLITNDDGATAPGLQAVAAALDAAGHDVVVVAPSGERSGWSAGVGYLVDGTTVDVAPASVDAAPHIPAWALDGPPALCVLVAMAETFGPRPDLVVSGANLGTNCGRGVLQSGTVGGAMIAQNYGLSALAISQDTSDEPMHWAASATVVTGAVDWLTSAPRKTVLNVNLPNRRPEDLAGVRWARLAAFGTTQTAIEGSVPGTLTVRVTPRDVELRPDTDTALVAAGYVTVTGLTGFRGEREVSEGAVERIAARLGGT